MKTRMLMVLVLLLIALVGCGKSEQTPTLNVDFTQLEDFRMSITTTQTTDNEMLNQETTAETYTEVFYDIVEIADDGTIKVDVTYETMVITQTNGLGNEQVSDSREEAIAFVDNPSAAMVGKTFTMIYGPNRDVIEVYGLAEIIEAGFDNSDELSALGDQAESYRTLMADILEDTTKRSNALTGGLVYPEGPIEIGTIWNFEQAIWMQFINLSLDNQAEVTSIEPEQITLAVSGTGTLDQGDFISMMEAMGVPDTANMEMEMTGDMEQTGTYIVSRKTGVIEGYDINATMNWEINAQGMSIPMLQTTTTVAQKLP